MDPALARLWAKSPQHSRFGGWQPLILHLLDMAASADAILERETATTRERMGDVLGLEWGPARPWLLVLIACHDLGKACPSFQAKWSDRPIVPGLRLPLRTDPRVNHGFVGQLVLTGVLMEGDWPYGLADLAADAVECHHGSRASGTANDRAEREIWVSRGAFPEAVRADWSQRCTGRSDEVRPYFPGWIRTDEVESRCTRPIADTIGAEAA